jgi:predicted DNA-binding protein
LEFFQVCKTKILEISEIGNDLVQALVNYIAIFYQKEEVANGLYSLSTYESLVRNPKQKMGPNKRPEKDFLNKTIKIPEKSPLSPEEKRKEKVLKNSKGDELIELILKYSNNMDYYELAIDAANEIDDPEFKKYSEDLLLKIRNIEIGDVRELFMLFADKPHLEDQSGEKLILKVADQTKEEKYLEIAVDAAEELEKPDFSGFKEVSKEIEKIPDPKIKAIFKNSESEKLNNEPYDPSTDPVFQQVTANGPSIKPPKPVQNKQINIGGRPKSDLVALVKSMSSNKNYVEIASEAAKELDNPNFTDFSEKTRRSLSSILDKNVKNAILAKRKSTLTSKKQKQKEEELKSLKNKPAFAQKNEPKKAEIQDVTDDAVLDVDDEPVAPEPTPEKINIAPEKAAPEPIAAPSAPLRARDRLRNFKLEPKPEPTVEPSAPLRARDRLRNFKI